MSIWVRFMITAWLFRGQNVHFIGLYHQSVLTETNCFYVQPSRWNPINTLRPRRNGQHSAGDIFKRIFFNENVEISLNISLKFVPKGPINNILALVQTMAWRRPGDKPLFEPMMVSFLTNICVIRPQWVNIYHHCSGYHDTLVEPA